MTDAFAPPPAGELVDLAGRVALVTGAGSGMGRACAVRFALAGAKVLCTDINIETAEATAAGIAKAGGEAIAAPFDVRSADQAERAAAQALSEWDGLDAVVNAAGIFPHRAALDTTAELWDEVHAVNVRGTFLTAQACARRMIPLGRGGTIVNIASRQAFQPSVGLAHYASSKGAVVGLTRTLALEWAPHGIRVNAVAPGGVNTEGARNAAQDMFRVAQQSAEEFGRTHASRVPIGRIAEPDEMAGIILFLSSPLSSYITGFTVLADGGFMLT
jgi:2-dehydro-3-deoxy-D-gluconate 5-dehydrogenase